MNERRYEMDNNIASVFEQYLKDLKPTASEDYLYVLRHKYFGDCVVVQNSTYVNIMSAPINLSDKYFDSMISYRFIKEGVGGYMCQLGILDDISNTYMFKCGIRLSKVKYMLDTFENDIKESSKINQYPLLNENETFFNNILCRKSDEGAGKISLGENMMILAPCMLPGSKTTPLDLITYHRDKRDYYVAVFKTHKPSGDILTLMRMLNI